MFKFTSSVNVAESLSRVRGSVLQALRAYEALNVDVGVFEDKAARENGKIPNTALAIIHEYGTDTIPQRSFLRAWSIERRAEILNNAERAMRTVGKLGPGAAQRALGVWMAGDVKRRIATNIPPPLAPSTIKRKGSSVALIDSGQLRTAIDWRPGK
jgi:hypothetical protein